MALQIEVGVEALLAVWALEPLHAAMDFHVLVQVRSLGETIGTARVVADVGSLVGVDAQMVEEVVPLPEPLVTPFVVAFKDFDEPLRSRVLVREDTELLSIRHVLLNVDRAKIEGVACLD